MAASVAQSNRQVLTKVGELHDMDLLVRTDRCLIRPHEMGRGLSEKRVCLSGWHLTSARHIEDSLRPCVLKGFGRHFSFSISSLVRRSTL